MSETNLRYLLSEPVMESFIDMRNAQPPADRLRYFDVALEGSTETNAILLQKLYTDIIARSNFDYGSIPDSKGALIKYKEYKLMSASMDALNKLFEGRNSDELMMMNRMHDMIISCRKDYEFGYNFDIEVIKISYCTSVLALYELINVAILAFTKELRDKNKLEFDFNKVKKKDVLVVRGATALLKSYESGQWSQMMKEFRKDPQLFNASEVATEGLKDMAENIVKGIASADTNNQYGDGKFGGRVKAAGAAVGKFATKFKVPLIVAGSVLAFIGIFVAIRSLIFFFYNSASKLKDYVQTQKEFVDATLKNEMSDGTSEKVIDKHSKLSKRLEGIANFIEFRILKTNKDATKDIADADKENYSKAELKPVLFTGDIEF